MSIDDYEQICQVSIIGKSNLLSESTYQVLRVVPILTQHTTGHTDLLFPHSSSREAVDSKAHYDLEEAKVVSFYKEYSMLCACLNIFSSLMIEVKQFGSSVTLAGRITKLEKLLKEKGWGVL